MPMPVSLISMSSINTLHKLREKLERIGSTRDLTGYTPLNRTASFFRDEHGGLHGDSRDSTHCPEQGGKACSEVGKHVPVPGRAVAYRTKKSRVMKWLVLHADGNKEVFTMDKRQLTIAFRLDVPVRDMRLMDNVLKLTGTGDSMHGGNNHLLVRDSALVMSMEHIRCIITADLVIIPVDDERSEVNERFNAYLEQLVQERLAESASSHALAGHGPSMGGGAATGGGGSLFGGLSAALSAVHPGASSLQGFAQHGSFHPPLGGQQGTASGYATPHHPLGLYSHTSVGMSTGNLGFGQAAQNKHDVYDDGSLFDLPRQIPAAASAAHPLSHPAPPPANPSNHHHPLGMSPPQHPSILSREWDVEGPATPNRTGPHSQRGSEELPWELFVLEAALGEVCGQVSREAEHLYANAVPALEDLVVSSDRGNLERVRRVKTAHQRLEGRVRALRDAMHRLMEDDQDMWRMCLSRNVQRKGTTNGNLGHQRTGSGIIHHAASIGNNIPSPQLSSALSDSELNVKLGASLRNPSSVTFKVAKRPMEGGLGTEHVPVMVSNGPLDEDDMHDVLDVEALLETYYLASDVTLATLNNIGEYIDDTEDLVNIQLDYARNKLIRFEVVLTTGTFALAFMSCVAGVLGENLVLPESITQDLTGFIIVNGSVLLICLTIFFTIYGMLKGKKLI